MRTEALILDNGEVMDQPVTARARAFASPDAIFGPANQADGRRCGRPVRWTSTSSLIRIDLDPTTLSQPAFERLSSWMEYIPAGRLVWINYLNTTPPSYEIRVGPEAAQKAMMSRLAQHRRKNIPYLRHIIDPGAIPRHAQGLEEVFAIWREHGTRLTQHVAKRLCDANDRRIVILRPTSDRGHIVGSSGSGYDPTIGRWLSANVGSPMQNWPDQIYGVATERSYHEVTTRGRPIHDEIDCHVVWPGGERQRRRYRRLLLPAQTTCGQQLLLVATRVDSTIDLRSSSRGLDTARTTVA